MSAPTRLPPCGLLLTVGPQRLQKSVNNGRAIRNLPRAGANMHLSVCRCEHAPPAQGLPSPRRLPLLIQSGTWRPSLMVSFYRPCSRRSSVSVSGGIADWPHRRRCRTTSVPRPVCGPGRASRCPSEGTTSMQMGCQPVDASAHVREIGRGDVRGQYTETNSCTCCTSGAFSKLNQVHNRPPMGREERTLFVWGWLRRVCTCALSEVVHVVHGKVGKPVHQRYMLRQEVRRDEHCRLTVKDGCDAGRTDAER